MNVAGPWRQGIEGGSHRRRLLEMLHGYRGGGPWGLDPAPPRLGELHRRCRFCTEADAAVTWLREGGRLLLGGSWRNGGAGDEQGSTNPLTINGFAGGGAGANVMGQSLSSHGHVLQSRESWAFRKTRVGVAAPRPRENRRCDARFSVEELTESDLAIAPFVWHDRRHLPQVRSSEKTQADEACFR